jgi:Protein of unknown function (DUF4232)
MRRILSLAVLLGGLTVASGFVATSALASTPSCKQSTLKVHLGLTQGAAGTMYTPIIFTNIGPTTCSIFGVPGVQPGNLVASGFHPVGPPSQNMSIGMLGSLHKIKHGQSVSSAFGAGETGNYTAGQCVAANTNALRIVFASYWRGVLRMKNSVCTKLASTHVQLIVIGVNGS